MSRRGRGGSGGRGRAGRGGSGRGTTNDADNDMFRDQDRDIEVVMLPLRDRIRDRPTRRTEIMPTIDDEDSVGSQLDENDQMNIALAESMETLAKEEMLRHEGVIGQPIYENDVLSEDEDNPAELTGKGGANRFVSSGAIAAASNKHGTTNKKTAKNKITTVSDGSSASGTSRSTRSKTVAEKYSVDDDRRPGHFRDAGPPLDQWQQMVGFGTSTKPKSTTTAPPEAPGARSVAEAPRTATAITEIMKLEHVEATASRTDSAMDLKPGMRFNPFTNCVEPTPNFGKSMLPAVSEVKKEGQRNRILTPHDFEFDSTGRKLTTPLEKARAYCDYLDERNRKAHEHNNTILMEPSKTVTYREGEILGIKGRNMEAQSDLCKWFDDFFGDSWTEESRRWFTEHRAFKQEMEKKSAVERKEEDKTEG